jgi:catechol 2,3-dioxygenase-like lactoylglutathione lyase family enzyme
MGKKLRQGKPWMPGYRYSALLTPFSLNLLVRDVAQSAAFYERVLQAEVHYHDVDFGAMRVGAIEVMLHADHTHDEHPWHEALQAGAKRGIGGQFRLLGYDPDAAAERAEDAVIVPPADKGHGWREVLIRDPDGYEWALGVLIPPAKGPHTEA